MEISANIDSNITYIEHKFRDWSDIVKRKFFIGKNKDKAVYIIYIDDMADRGIIEDCVMQTLMLDIRLAPPSENELKVGFFDALLDGGITTADLKEVNNMDDALLEVMVGNSIMLIDGFEKAISISTKGFPKRGVEKAETEVVVQGPKEAFAESIRINTVLVRRRIRDTHLRCHAMQIGKKSKTDVALMYLDNEVNPKILQECKRRLKNINTDVILDSGYIEQYIEDSAYSPFPQIQLTERPDKCAAEILQGRIAVITDNSPFVLLIPTVLASFYQAAEDYYQRWEIMSFIRIIRYIAGFFAFALPGIYIAVTLYHPSMLPLDLALRLAGARRAVPIPTVLEMIIMELAFEALREAGIRLPAAIGSTLGIVGGIIIGQAAVDAGLVSPMIVIIVALTGICSFAIPNISLVSAYRLIKYFIIALGAFFGLPGVVAGIIIVTMHLGSLKSFGIPYTAPFTATREPVRDRLKDTIFRLPLFMLKKTKVFRGENNDK